jgi:hypothetical protein
MVPEPLGALLTFARFHCETMVLHGPDPRNHWNHRNWKGVCARCTPRGRVCAHVGARAYMRPRV